MGLSATAHEHQHERGICHVMLMIRVKMNYRYIMYFSGYALYMLWLLEGHLFMLRCAHTFLQM